MSGYRYGVPMRYEVPSMSVPSLPINLPGESGKPITLSELVLLFNDVFEDDSKFRETIVRLAKREAERG